MQGVAITTTFTNNITTWSLSTVKLCSWGEAIAVKFNYLIPQICCNNCSKQQRTRSKKRSHAVKCRQRLNSTRTVRPNLRLKLNTRAPRERHSGEFTFIDFVVCMRASLRLCVCGCVQRQKQRSADIRIALFVFVRVFRIAKMKADEMRTSSERKKPVRNKAARRAYKESVRQQYCRLQIERAEFYFSSCYSNTPRLRNK